MKAQNEKNKRMQTEMSKCTFHPETHFPIQVKKVHSEILNTNMNIRYHTWNNIKTKKIKNIYFQKMNHENSFKYTPDIQRDPIYFTTIDKRSDQVVLDPESYKMYVDLRKKFLTEKSNEKKRRENIVGNGKIWREKYTKIKEFTFETEKRHKRAKSANKLSTNSDSNSYIIINTINVDSDFCLDEVKERLHNELHKMIL